MIDFSRVVTTIVNDVDAIGTNYVTQSYKALSDLLTGANTGIDFATLLLTLYMIFWGLSIWAGTARTGVVDMTYRLFRVFVIYTLATTWGEYNKFVYAWVQALPNGLSEAMLSSVNSHGGGYSSATSVYSGLDDVVQGTAKTYTAFIEKGDIMNWGPWIAGLLLCVPVFILVAYSAFLIILSKIFVWMMMALGPIAIILLLFEKTNAYFSGWLKVVINFMILQILVYAVVAFYLVLTKSFFDSIDASSTVDWPRVAAGSIVAIIGIYLVSQIMNVASNISGAIALGGPSLGMFLANSTAAGLFARNAVGNAGRAAVGTGSAATWAANRAGYYTHAQRMRDRADVAVQNFKQKNSGAVQAVRQAYLNSDSHKQFVQRSNSRAAGNS